MRKHHPIHYWRTTFTHFFIRHATCDFGQNLIDSDIQNLISFRTGCNRKCCIALIYSHYFLLHSVYSIIHLNCFYSSNLYCSAIVPCWFSINNKSKKDFYKRSYICMIMEILLHYLICTIWNWLFIYSLPTHIVKEPLTGILILLGHLDNTWVAESRPLFK